MNVVLYTRDFEPITVLDLPLWLLDQLERQGHVRVAVLRPLSPHSVKEPTSVPVGSVDGMQTVTITCEKLRWRDGSTKTILVTQDEELALVLRPEWLPGQVATVKGQLSAIKALQQALITAMRKN